jgi:hypothetical protein
MEDIWITGGLCGIGLGGVDNVEVQDRRLAGSESFACIDWNDGD